MAQGNQNHSTSAGHNETPPNPSVPSNRLKQFELIYDYIKFHIALYLGTPAVFVVVAEAFKVKTDQGFRGGLIAMIIIYLISGAHATWYIMGDYINVPWPANFPDDAKFEYLFTWRRRFWHHHLYWAGIFCGVAGLIYSVFWEPRS
jgi:hypothetical protein